MTDATEPGTPTRSQRHRRPWLRRLLMGLGVAIVVGLLLLVTALVVLTGASGSAWLVRLVSARVPGTLEVAHVEGSLRGGLHLEGLRYRADGHGDAEPLTITVAEVDLTVQPWPLLMGRLNVEQLVAREVDIALPPAEDDESEPFTTLPEISLPIAVRIEEAAVHDLRWHAPDAPGQSIDQAILVASVQGDRLHLDALTLRSALFDLNGTGTLGTHDAYPLDLDVDWTVRLDDLAPIHGRGPLTGDLRALRLEQQLDAATSALGLRGQIAVLAADGVDGGPALDVVIDIERLQPRALNADWPAYDVVGQLTVTGALDAPSLAGTLEVAGPVAPVAPVAPDAPDAPDASPWQLELAVVGTSLRRWQVEHLNAAHADFVEQLRVAGLVELIDDGDTSTPTFDLEIAWQGIHYPTGDLDIQSSDGTATLSGRLDDYQLDTNVALHIEHADGTGSQGRLALAGRGTSSSFQVERLDSQVLGGTVGATGRIAWQPNLALDLEARARGLDPGTVWTDWPGRLNLDGRVSLTSDAASNALRGSVKDVRLNGRLRERDLTATASLGFEADGSVDIERTVARWGGATLEARGGIDQTYDLTFDLEAPDLADLLPDIAGGLRAKGRVTGARARPTIEAEVTGTSLAYGDDLRADGVDATVALTLAPDGRADIDMAVDRLRTASVALTSAMIQTRGTIAEHTIDVRGTGQRVVESSADPSAIGVALVATGHGDWTRQQWRSTVGTLDVTLAPYGDWRLAAPARVAVDRSSIEVRDVCWVADGARACVPSLRVAGSDWQLTAEVTNAPLAFVQPFLPATLTLEGVIDGTFEATSNGGDPVQVTAHIAPGPGRLRYRTSADRQADVAYEGGIADLTITDSRADLVADLELGTLGHLAGNLAVPWPLVADPAPGDDDDNESHALTRGPVRGDLRFALNELTLLAMVLPTDTVAHVAGRLAGDVQVSGTTWSPHITGSASWRDGGVHLLAPDLILRDVTLTARGNQGDIQLNGAFTSGTGTATIKGSLAVAAQEATLDVNGSNLEVLNDPDLRLAVGPALTFHATPRRLDVRGSVSLDRAQVSVAVSPSRNETRTLEGLGQFEVDLFADEPLADAEQTTLGGTIQATIDDLTFLPGFIDALEDTAGQLTADVTLGGTRAAPLVTGEARVREGRVKIPAYGLTLTELTLDAVERGTGGARIRGEARSGEGSLSIEGTLDAWGRQGDVTLRGKDITVVDRAEATIVASPDLTLTLRDERLAVRGNVAIPRARIDLDQDRATIGISPDVVVVGRDDEGFREALVLSTDVRLRLGDDVTFKGFGLDLAPKGSIQVLDEPGRAQTAVGELRVEDGTYRIYGQTLTIDSGRIAYSGGPLSNPQLDIRATRKTRSEVVAGVRLRGTLADPETEVFTEPSSTPSDALAYLVIGQPLVDADEAERGSLAAAAANVGLRRGNLLLKPLGSKLGLDDASFQNTNNLDDARLFLGKNLSERLYVAYGIGLFRPTNTFLARYRLFKHLTLQARTGTETEVDLLFESERGTPAPRRPVRVPTPPD